MALGFGNHHPQPAIYDAERPPIIGDEKIPLHLRQSSTPIETVKTLLDSDPSEPNYPHLYDTESGRYIYGKGKALLATEATFRVVDFPRAEMSVATSEPDVLDHLVASEQLTYSA